MADPINTFLIEEDVQGGLKCELRDTDMPYGRPREMLAFETGGEMVIAQGGIYNPGSDRPVLQMMQPKERPLVLKGAFRDRIYPTGGTSIGSSQEGSDSNHARSMRDRLEQIRRRAFPLKITWGGETRSGVLWETKFGEEGLHDLSYELRFFIAVPPNTAATSQTSLTKPTASIEDLTAQMKTALVAAQAKMAALYIVASIAATISNAFTSVSAALDVCTTTALAFTASVASTPQAIQNNLNKVSAAANSVQTAVVALKATLDATRADTAMIVDTSDSFTQYWSAQSATEYQLDQILDAMRQVRYQAQQIYRANTRLYRVQASDTLESIAQQQLGSRSRAPDLGLTADRLVVGAYIRIPQAS